MNLYDENGNRVIVRNNGGGNGCLRNFLTIIFFAIVVVGAIFLSRAIIWFVSAPVEFSESVDALSHTPTPNPYPTETIEFRWLESDIKATAEFIVQEIKAEEERLNQTPLPQFLTDGGLPYTLPYSPEQVEQCKVYIENGVLLISPQKEFCDQLVSER